MELLGGLPRAPRTSTSKFLSRTPQELWGALKAVKTRRELATLLEIPYEHLTYLLFRMRPSLRYERFVIGKEDGRPRSVLGPNRSLKILQRKMVQAIAASYSPCSIAHGFVADRSIVTNASVHVRKRNVLSIDLEDFFGSINFGRVRGLFLKAPFTLPPEVATALAQIATFENSLPQGAPTSPLLSNLICRSLDRDLSQLARRAGCDVTRFVDDIVFSTNKMQFDTSVVESVSDTGRPELGLGLRRIVANNGFSINDGKTKLSRRGSRQVVTGVVVGDSMSPRSRIVRSLRALIHLWASKGRPEAEDFLAKRASRRHKKPGAKPPSLEKSIEGGLSYWSMVSGAHNSRLRKSLLLYRQLNPASLVLKHKRSFEERILASLVVVEGDTTQGTGFMVAGLGVVTCAHVIEPSSYIFRTGQEYAKSPVKVLALDASLDVALLECPFAIPVSLEIDTYWTAEIGARIFTAGFPNQNFGDSGTVQQGAVAGHRNSPGGSVILVGSGATIVFGQSGGPALNASGGAIGVCVRGASADGEAPKTEKHEVIPIARLMKLLGSS